MKNRTNLFDLSDKNVIITGSAGFLGNQHCEAILEHNGNPILIDINKISLESQKKKLEKKYKKKILCFRKNLTSPNSLKSIRNHLLKNNITIYALINNADYNPQVDINKKLNNFENENFTEWKKHLSIGLDSTYLASKYLGSLIKKNKKGGVIINISSDLGLISPNQSLYNTGKELTQAKPISYSASKSAIIGMTRYLATYWANYNIRCNALCFGGMEKSQDKKFKKKLANLIPLKRMAKKNEYQSSIIWMLSDYTSYLNGSIVSVDGGRTVW